MNTPEIQKVSLKDLNFKQIQEYISSNPSIILPLGGLEPLGSFGTIGDNSLCANALTQSVSNAISVVSAPLVEYGCTTQFKAFSGSAGVKPKTMSNYLFGLCNDWFYQGIKRILIINGIEGNGLALDLLIKRYHNLNGQIEIVSLHSDMAIRDILAGVQTGAEFDRLEFMILSIASFLKNDRLNCPVNAKVDNLPEKKVFTKWKKSGRDPDKLKKMIPSGSLSSIAQEFNIEAGKVLFTTISDYLIKKYSPFLKFTDIK
jgi:creatinine amidohydrolase/Fe(II)-dependent formamide hydrolase-like protein